MSGGTKKLYAEKGLLVFLLWWSMGLYTTAYLA